MPPLFAVVFEISVRQRNAMRLARSSMDDETRNNTSEFFRSEKRERAFVCGRVRALSLSRLCVTGWHARQPPTNSRSSYDSNLYRITHRTDRSPSAMHGTQGRPRDINHRTSNESPTRFVTSGDGGCLFSVDCCCFKRSLASVVRRSTHVGKHNSDAELESLQNV